MLWVCLPPPVYRSPAQHWDPTYEVKKRLLKERMLPTVAEAGLPPHFRFTQEFSEGTSSYKDGASR